MALLGPIKFSVGNVPITLQTFILFGIAAVFGKYTGFYASILYLLLGAIGVPVFAGYTEGIAKLSGPTAGFLWAFPIIVYYIGWECERSVKNFYYYILNFFKAHILLLIPGMLVVYLNIAGLDIAATIIRLLPGLMIKSIIGGLLSFWIVSKLNENWTEIEVS